MKRKTLLLVVVVALFCLSACASVPVAVWKADDAQGIVGKTEAQIIEKFGQPDSVLQGSDKKVLVYKKPAEKEGARNKFMAFGSYGLLSGAKSMYVDILRVVFKNNTVTDFSYEENVSNMSVPGL